MNSIKSLIVFSFLSSFFFVAQPAFAGGCAPGEPCYGQFRKPTKPTPPPAVEEEVIESAPAADEKPAMSPVSSGLRTSVAGGINVLFFDCEDAAVAPGIYANYRIADAPLNIRLGFEGTRFKAEQWRFATNQPFEQEPNINYFRFPLALEFVAPIIGDATELFVGAGPELDVINGTGNDTDVGWHVGARIEHAVADNLGLSLSSGYSWSDMKMSGEEVDLDSAYVGTHLTYNFN